MFLNAFVFVVVAIVRASFGIEAEKIAHFVLVKREGAGVAVGIFIVLIKFAAFAARLMLDPIFGEIHGLYPKSLLISNTRSSIATAPTAAER